LVQASLGDMCFLHTQDCFSGIVERKQDANFLGMTDENQINIVVVKPAIS